MKALALVAVLAALASALALSRGSEAHVTAPHAVTKETAFRLAMRTLWSEHAAWTRQVIVSVAAGTPDLDVAVKRLLRNQTDIGNAVAPYYGRAAGRQLTRLLREHIVIAADLLGAAKQGDAEALADAQARWARNGDAIAAFLTKANPDHWPAAATRSMMRAHLALTTREAVARLNGRWAADVAAADAVNRQILHMADALANGIVAQFPGRFRG